jgi:hypothetical protein
MFAMALRPVPEREGKDSGHCATIYGAEMLAAIANGEFLTDAGQKFAVIISESRLAVIIIL